MLKSHLINFCSIILIMLFAIATSDISSINNTRTFKEGKNENQEDKLPMRFACPGISGYDFTTIDFRHKIKIQYNDAGDYPVVLWESNDPQTTTLDYDGGDWAYYHNNGYGYLDIKITVDDNGNNCTSTHIVYY